MPKLADTYAAHPMIRWVRSLNEPYFLPIEVAEMLDIAPSMLHYWSSRNPEAQIGPSHHARYQDVDISLYTPERVERLRAFIEGQRDGYERPRGRTRIFTPAENQNRRRIQRRIRDFRTRAPEMEARGKVEHAKKILAKADDLEQQLEVAKTERIKELQAEAARQAKKTRPKATASR